MRIGFAVVGVLAVLCTAHSPSAAEPCAPAATVDGDETLTRPVLRELRSLGVEAAAQKSCPTARARVRRVGARLGITVYAADGRTHQRTVSTPGIAAMWIESRVRDDLGAPLLRTRLRTRLPTRRLAAAALVAPPAAPPAMAAAPPSEVRRVQSTTHASMPLAIRAQVGAATGADDSEWRTVSVGGCALVGGLCVGVEGTYGRNAEFVTEELPFGADRKSVDLMVTIGTPVRIGRGTLSPQLGIGIGWLTTSRASLDSPIAPDPGCDPSNPGDATNPDGTCDPVDPNQPPTLDDSLRAATASLRSRARVRYAVPLTDGAALEIGVGIVWAPMAHTKSFRFDGVGPDATIVAPIATEPGAADPFTSLPGEPAWRWNAGIGLRVELR